MPKFFFLKMLKFQKIPNISLKVALSKKYDKGPILFTFFLKFDLWSKIMWNIWWKHFLTRNWPKSCYIQGVSVNISYISLSRYSFETYKCYTKGTYIHIWTCTDFIDQLANKFIFIHHQFVRWPCMYIALSKLTCNFKHRLIVVLVCVSEVE